MAFVLSPLVVEGFVLGVLALELGNNLFHGTDGLHVALSDSCVDEVVDDLAYLFILVFTHLGHLNLGVERWKGLFLVVENLLVEFLSVTEAGEDDFNVACSTQAYHASGKVSYFDRFAHVKDVDFATVAHSTGLDDELTGLGDEHEVAYDVGVGDGDGLMATYLFLEDGDYRAVGAQHVAKTRGDKLSRSGGGIFFEHAVEALDIYFTDALRAAHDIGGVDGFVGGDHYKFLRAILDGEVGNDLGAEDVVNDTLVGVILHHGHVLVGRSMENILWTCLTEEALHETGVGDVAHYGVSQDVGPLTAHHESHVVHRRLGLVNEQKVTGTVGGYLPHHLGADAASCTGNHHDAIGDETRGGFHVNLNLVARQEILDVDRSEVGDAQLTLSVPLASLRAHEDAHSGIGHGIDYFAIFTQGGHHQGGDEQSADALLLHDVDKVEVKVIYGLTQQVVVGHFIVNSYETSNFEWRVDGRVDTLGDGNATLLDAEDEHRGGVATTVHVLVKHFNEQPLYPHQGNGDEAQ